MNTVKNAQCYVYAFYLCYIFDIGLCNIRGSKKIIGFLLLFKIVGDFVSIITVRFYFIVD